MPATPNQLVQLRQRGKPRHPGLNVPAPHLPYRAMPTVQDDLVLVALAPDEMAVLRRYWDEVEAPIPPPGGMPKATPAERRAAALERALRAIEIRAEAMGEGNRRRRVTDTIETIRGLAAAARVRGRTEP